MPDSIPDLMTIGDLATRFGVSTHRLKYAIEQHHVAPTRRVGIIRVWSEDKLPLIASALAKIAEKRGGLRTDDLATLDVPTDEAQGDVHSPAAATGQ